MEKSANVQKKFCREMGTTEAEAFIDFNLAPLGLTRDIGMLGLLYKCAHKTAHPALMELFPRCEGSSRRHCQRHHSLHDFQLLDRCDGPRTAMMDRSVFALVRVFNKLPVGIVEAPSVPSFQSRLTSLSRDQCMDGGNTWGNYFPPRRALNEISFPT